MELTILFDGVSVRLSWQGTKGIFEVEKQAGFGGRVSSGYQLPMIVSNDSIQVTEKIHFHGNPQCHFLPVHRPLRLHVLFLQIF